VNKEAAYYKIKRDSNFAYLPLVYFLPEEIFVACPTLRKLSRCFGDIAKSKEMRAIINSDNFRCETMDAVASLTFPHFGFGGWKEHYTGYSPVWKLSYSLTLWGKLLEEITGWGLQALFNMSKTEYVPFFEKDYINEAMRQVVKRAIDEQGWQPMLDVIKEMPCDEDYEKVNRQVSSISITSVFPVRIIANAKRKASEKRFSRIR